MSSSLLAGDELYFIPAIFQWFTVNLYFLHLGFHRFPGKSMGGMVVETSLQDIHWVITSHLAG